MISATGKAAAVASIELTQEPVLSPELERECRVYARYLSGQAPSRYLTEKYQDFHQKIGLPGKIGPFDRFLVSASARGPVWTRLADSYASICLKNSTLRQKLVLMLALLECAPPTFEKLDHVPAGGWTGAVLRLALSGAGYALTAAIAALLFTPVRVWMAARGR